MEGPANAGHGCENMRRDLELIRSGVGQRSADRLLAEVKRNFNPQVMDLGPRMEHIQGLGQS